MLRRVALTTLLVLGAQFVFAGDVAVFTNLGFSSNERVFMFGQYGVDRSTSTPYAEVFTVDVPDNEFVSGGVFRREFESRIGAGQDGSGALYQVLHEASAIISDHSVDHLRQGRIVYALLNKDEPADTIEFRDFNTGNRYRAVLRQNRRDSGESVRARFHIELERELRDGSSHTVTIGLPDHYRPGVSRYRIRQAILSPDERSLVFVVEMHRPVSSGTSIRYMVETVRFSQN